MEFSLQPFFLLNLYGFLLLNKRWRPVLVTIRCPIGNIDLVVVHPPSDSRVGVIMLD